MRLSVERGNSGAGAVTTITLPVQYYGGTFYRSQMKPDAWYVLAAQRLTGRWAKRMGSVLLKKSRVEHYRRPEYRDFEICITMEYVSEPGL